MKKTLALCAWLLQSACSESPKDPMLPTYPNCKAEGEVGCIARADFPAVDLAALTALAPSIKAGQTFVGITGMLADCSGDNGVDCVASAEYPSVVKAEITAATVVNGSTLAGVAGSFAPDCTADAEVACLTTEAFKAVDLGAISAWDIRAGKTFGGVEGSSSFYANAANLLIFDRTVGAGSGNSTSVADFYDSIDDAAGGTAIPILVPPGTPTIIFNWMRESTSDTDSDQTCDVGESCIYTDLLTGLNWLADDEKDYVWESSMGIDAIERCNQITIGSLNNWRLPTQKELFQAYVNRIYGLQAPLKLATTRYLSATTFSVLNDRAWSVALSRGLSTPRIKDTEIDRVICVH